MGAEFRLQFRVLGAKSKVSLFMFEKFLKKKMRPRARAFFPFLCPDQHLA